MRRRIRVVVVVGALGLAAGAQIAAATTRDEPSRRPPLIGTNYTHFAVLDCRLDGGGIVATYDVPTVREAVRQQLAAMRAEGIQTLRLILWHMSDPGERIWGIVPSAGGRLAEPYRTNFITYLSDVRSAGFEQLTVSFAPAVTNDPRAQRYDPSTLEENWQFLRDTRALIKRYGPPATNIDLMNEGAPAGTWQPSTIARVKAYIAAIYSRYVRDFGNDDVAISAIASRGRLQNLIDAYRASGQPLPNRFDIHIAYAPQKAYTQLQTVNSVLDANGLAQPLVISETAYNSGGVAAAIARFIGETTRQVDEVIEWPLIGGQSCRDISESPPYRADRYIAQLQQAVSPSSPSGGRGR